MLWIKGLQFSKSFPLLAGTQASGDLEAVTSGMYVLFPLGQWLTTDALSLVRTLPRRWAQETSLLYKSVKPIGGLYSYCVSKDIILLFKSNTKIHPSLPAFPNLHFITITPLSTCTYQVLTFMFKGLLSQEQRTNFHLLLAFLTCLIVHHSSATQV